MVFETIGIDGVGDEGPSDGTNREAVELRPGGNTGSNVFAEVVVPMGELEFNAGSLVKGFDEPWEGRGGKDNNGEDRLTGSRDGLDSV